jgi:beta-glucanase (GH16 family)
MAIRQSWTQLYSGLSDLPAWRSSAPWNKWNLKIFALSLFIVLPAAVWIGASQALPETPGWKLTFDDEFNGNKINLSHWNVSNYASVINQEQQYYTPDSIVVQHGFLRITTAKRFFGGREYTSGEITTRGKFAQLYGYFEARLRFPTTKGLWSCIYLLPKSGVWPPEIDISEYLTRTPDELYLTNHWRGSDGRHWQLNSYLVDPRINFTEWHVYAVDWEPGSVRWYVDGRLVGSSVPSADVELGQVNWYVDGESAGTAPSNAIGPPNGPNVTVSSTPMYIRINDCIGIFGGSPANGPWPQYFDIDYVRVYKRLPARHR